MRYASPGAGRANGRPDEDVYQPQREAKEGEIDPRHKSQPDGYHECAANGSEEPIGQTTNHETGAKPYWKLRWHPIGVDLVKGKDVIAELALGFPGVRQPFFEAVDSSEVALVSSAVARYYHRKTSDIARSLARSLTSPDDRIEWTQCIYRGETRVGLPRAHIDRSYRPLLSHCFQLGHPVLGLRQAGWLRREGAVAAHVGCYRCWLNVGQYRLRLSRCRR